MVFIVLPRISRWLRIGEETDDNPSYALPLPGAG